MQLNYLFLHALHQARTLEQNCQPIFFPQREARTSCHVRAMISLHAGQFEKEDWFNDGINVHDNLCLRVALGALNGSANFEGSNLLRLEHFTTDSDRA